MSRDVRVYRDKVWLSGKARRQLLSAAEELGLTPVETLKLAIFREREGWQTERQKHWTPEPTPESP